VIDRQDIGSWLSGDGAPRPDDGYPGQRLGRPGAGPGALAGTGRRLVSVAVDWLICLLIVRGFLGEGGTTGAGSLWVSVLFGVLNLVLVATAGCTIGQRLVRVRVETVQGGRPGVGAATVRAVLLVLALPAFTLLWERDRRGLHELTSGTLVARF
jgi:uncharacterized RDD family membrane protein YckC